MIDVNKAMLDPTMVFEDPKDVVANVGLIPRALMFESFGIPKSVEV